jgi:heterodisulfide reductase subunit D
MESLKSLTKEIYRCIHCKACRFAYSGEPDRQGMGECNGCLYEGTMAGCPSGKEGGKEGGWEAYWNAGKIWMARAVLEGDLEFTDEMADMLFKCPTCGLCEAQCENKISTVDVIEALRAAYIESGASALAKHVAMRNAVDDPTMWNPYKEKQSDRTAWYDGKRKNLKNADIAFFVGCTASYRQKQIAKSTQQILDKLGVNYTVLTDEACCGSPMIRTGQLPTAKKVIEKNMKLFKPYKHVLFCCAGCYRTFTVDYPKILGSKLPFETKHSMDFISDLIVQNKLKITKPLNMKVTWHDPCHLGRHIAKQIEKDILAASNNWLVDQRKADKAKEEWFEKPRRVLKAIPGLQLVEMYRIKEDSYCCGSGGGVKSQYPEMAIDTAKERIVEAQATGAQAIVTSCPFCLTNLGDALKQMGSNMQVLELLDVLNKVM